MPEHAHILANDLVAREVLTTDAKLGKPFEPTRVRPANRNIDLQLHRDWTPSVVLRAGPFFMACRRANLSLKALPFETTIRTAERRKSDAAAETPAFNLDRCAKLISQFDILRPYFPRNYLCLFDSFALLTYLAIYDLYPTWIFGVRATPFAAHCWLQEGDFALNDSADVISAYTPVLAI